MEPNTLYVVVEGKESADYLRRILPDRARAKCEFVLGKGKSSAISDARTLMVLSDRPIALVLNADTENLEEVERQRDTLRQLLRSGVRSPKTQAFLAIPSLA